MSGGDDDDNNSNNKGTISAIATITLTTEVKYWKPTITISSALKTTRNNQYDTSKTNIGK